MCVCVVIVLSVEVREQLVGSRSVLQCEFREGIEFRLSVLVARAIGLLRHLVDTFFNFFIFGAGD